MPKRQEDLIGGLSRRDTEKAILFLLCLRPEILTLPPRQLFDIKEWSAINGFSRKNQFKAGNSNWCYLRNKILKWQQDTLDADGATSDSGGNDDVFSTSIPETSADTQGGNGKIRRKEYATKLNNPAIQDQDDDEEPVASGMSMVERVIEFVDLEPIEIKDEDQFELDWRTLELYEQQPGVQGDEEMERETR